MRALAGFLILAFITHSALGDTKPAAKLEKIPAPPPAYDESADGQTQIHKALADAKKENRRVLISWGANWCSWCRVLHEEFQTEPELRKTLTYEYDVVRVDVGRRTKHTKLVESYGVDLNKNGIPYLTILDADGKVLVNQPTDDFEIAKNGKEAHDPKKLQEFLQKHQAAPVKAEEVLAKAFAEAKQSSRNVFLHFGAPWCGWCHRLDAWLAKPEIAAILAKDYVEVKVDQDRMIGGKEMLERYNTSKAAGIPWFVILSPEGKAIITSTGPQGNIGFPSAAEEVNHFIKMVEASKHRMTSKEVAMLRKSLTATPKTAAQKLE